MTDDIVKRLLEEPWVAETHYEAADEIKRLRAELAAERERVTKLREALVMARNQLPEHRREYFDAVLSETKGDGDE